ncbi:hypothetical protein TSUD_340970 [Trifolium subterraneum]|uniref:Cathepsin propeptide inhibitor domain-containing protein n=1 Tax=Trifolium subterraneum TaxID=3900 RepID=A0A2Z6LJF9_TRISU|nr:hypothetical protein TSUD_340970 [Trifolium subterraneum]
MMEVSHAVLDLNFFEVFEYWNKKYHKTYSSEHCKLDHFFYWFKLWHKEHLKAYKEYLKAYSLEED